MSKMLSGIGHVKEDDFDYEIFINKNKKKLQLTNRFHLLSICVVRVDE
jgi:hypothetical protein